jgi:hypothetical protein
MGAALGGLWAWMGTAGLAELANGVGLFVALAGIALTLAQLRLFRRQLQLDALIKIMESNREIVALGFAHPLVWAALESGTVLAEEARARRRYLQLWTNHMQIMWAAWQLGLVSGREWQAYRLDLGEFLRSPALQEHWAAVARFYPKGFQRLVAELSTARRRDS